MFKLKHATHVMVTGNGEGGLHGQGATWWNGTMAENAPPLLEVEEASQLEVSLVQLLHPGTIALSIKGSSSVDVAAVRERRRVPVVGAGPQSPTCTITMKLAVIACTADPCLRSVAVGLRRGRADR